MVHGMRSSSLNHKNNVHSLVPFAFFSVFQIIFGAAAPPRRPPGSDTNPAGLLHQPAIAGWGAQMQSTFLLLQISSVKPTFKRSTLSWW